MIHFNYSSVMGVPRFTGSPAALMGAHSSTTMKSDYDMTYALPFLPGTLSHLVELALGVLIACLFSFARKQISGVLFNLARSTIKNHHPRGYVHSPRSALLLNSKELLSDSRIRTLVYDDATPTVQSMHRCAHDWSVDASLLVAWIRHHRREHRVAVNRKRFIESVWRLSLFSVGCVIGLITMPTKQWIWDFTHFFSSIPSETEKDIRVFYVFHMALSLHFLHAKLSHMPQSLHERSQILKYLPLCHDLAAALLVFGTWMAGATRIGSAVIFIHTLSDPFLEASKLMETQELSHFFSQKAVVLLLATASIHRVFLTPIFFFNVSQSYPSPSDTNLIGVAYRTLDTLLITLYVTHLVQYTKMLWSSLLAVFDRFQTRKAAQYDADVSANSGDSRDGSDAEHNTKDIVMSQ